MRTSIVVATALTSALVATTAHAQADSDKATARQLYEDGATALEKKDFAKAKDLFTRARKLFDAPTIAVGLARSDVGLGLLVEAHEIYQVVIRAGVPTNAPKAFQNAVTNAKNESAAIEPRIGGLVITVTGAPNPTVTVDGAEVSSAALGVKRATNPGARKVAAKADGFDPVEQTVTVAEGRSVPVTLKLTASKAASAEPATGKGAPATTTEAPPPDAEGPSRVPVYIAYGVGGAGLALGLVTGGLALGKNSTLKSACPDHTCHGTSERSASDSFNTLTTLSTVGFIVAGVGAVVGTGLLVFTPKPAASALTVSPFVGAGNAGFAGQF